MSTGHPHPGAPPPLDVAATLRGRSLLVTGATGFLGKVTLSLLLERYPDIGRVFVLVRPGMGGTAEDRFFGAVAAGRPFDPLRARHGDGFDAFLRARCVPLAGDVTEPGLGLSPQDLARLAGVDAVVNCAGLVDFSPSLELALSVNVEGVRHAVELAGRLSAGLLHVSTCYVAGGRDGVVEEDEPIGGYFPRAEGVEERPRQPTLPGPFSVATECADAAARIAEVRAQADDTVQGSAFLQAARERLRTEGRAGDEKAVRLAVARERRLWLSQRLVELGLTRARTWGWPNTYTYSKSMGEQLLAASELCWAICRPSIVESALRYPFPGWNEGFTTSAPLAFLGLKGHRAYPSAKGAILDVVPVDLVAAALLAATAELLERRQAGARGGRVYHLASGDVNPLWGHRSVELTALYRRRFFRTREEGNPALNQLLARLEPYPVSRRHYETFSAPAWARGARLARRLLREETPRWGTPRLSAAAEGLAGELDEVIRRLDQTAALWELYLPFVWDHRYVFRCAAIRALRERLSPADRARLPWDPEALDWRNYWLDVHLKGMEDWVFPGLEEASRKRSGPPRAHRDLVELLEAAAETWPARVALRRDGARRETYTFSQLRDAARRAALALRAAGVRPGEVVLLCAEPRPEWAVALFGVALAGGAAAPLDPTLAPEVLAARAAALGARLAVVDEAGAAALGPSGPLLHLHQLLAGGPEAALPRPASDEVALVTLGEDGRPAPLHGRALCALASRLGTGLALGPGDALLSTLPLDQPAGLARGLLLPLSRGAEVDLHPPLDAAGLEQALDAGRTTALAGGAPLWALLRDRVERALDAGPRPVAQALDLLARGSGALRDSSLGWNLGRVLFWPVHRALGGRLSRLVTDGAPLEPEAARLFRELGLEVAAPAVPSPAHPAPRHRRGAARDEGGGEVDVPAPLAALGRRLLGMGQRALYQQLYATRVVGQAHVPHDRNVLVVANHASHLDMGLVKVALAEEGSRLAALAARDYFFDTPLKRAYFENFTDLVPMDRDRSPRASLRAALTTLASGRHLLIFPEGTRTRDGAIRPFFPTAGFLALHARVDVLPCYLAGTFEAFPPGAAFPKKAPLEVRFGEPIRLADLEGLAAGVSRAEGYRRATRVMEDAVRRLGGELGDRAGGAQKAPPVPPLASPQPHPAAPPLADPAHHPGSKP